MLLPISLPRNHQSVCIVKSTDHLGCNALPETDMNVSLCWSWDLVTVKHFVTAWRLEALPPIDLSVFAILTSFGAWRRQYRSTQSAVLHHSLRSFFFLFKPPGWPNGIGPPQLSPSPFPLWSIIKHCLWGPDGSLMPLIPLVIVLRLQGRRHS